MSERKVPHILKLSAQEQKEFVNSFDVVMCDCDGVMWMMASPLPRTGEAVNALKADGKKVLFVSNNSVRTDEEYTKKFVGIGVKDFQENDIIHPVKAILYYMKKHNIKEPVFSVCSAPGNVTFRKAGIDVRTLQINEEVTCDSYYRITEPQQKMGAVLFDSNFELSYLEILAAIRYLGDKDCKLLAGGTELAHSRADGEIIPGFLSFLEIIKRFTGREPTMVSKPALLLGEILKDVYKLIDPKRCLFVGDSMKADVRFGLNSGYQTLLVLSGSSRIEEIWEASAEDRPHYYADSMADFIELYENISKNA